MAKVLEFDKLKKLLVFIIKTIFVNFHFFKNKLILVNVCCFNVEIKTHLSTLLGSRQIAENFG